ncbi:MAG: nucleotidyltransferase domain-containing protein [Chloroflexi bacterium]|nr:nucleotidyltransferase domain-containing protein [Chloroflexota bacterium]
MILFGSYAYGDPTGASDVDLLVILPFEGSNMRKAVEIMNRVSPRFPVDLLVRTPEQVRQRLAWNDFFLREVMEKGKVLYESAHP